MPEKVRKRPGPISLFPGKRRAPVSLTLTPEHHEKVEKNKRRIGRTRADLIGLLIEKYADSVPVPGEKQDYARLRDAVVALGGTLEHRKWNGPRGATWVLTLHEKHLPVQSEVLDACYRLKPGAVAVPAGEDYMIDPEGLARLFTKLAAR